MNHMLLGGLVLFALIPSTTNYKLNAYTFGSGGTKNSSTTTYALEGTVGQVGATNTATTTYTTKPNFVPTQQANVPKIAAFDNNSNQYYNKLHFTIDTQGNPSDALYALSISTDNFSTDIRYVKSDHTVGASLTLADYQTYTSWGGASGTTVIGLNAGTTYYLRAKATQGKFTESAYGPAANALTASPSITFGVTTSTQSVPPFSVNFGSLLPGVITTGPSTINIALTTNAANGADVYIAGQNNGLKSPSTSYVISSLDTDLSSVNEGFGAQSVSATQVSGGPFSAVSPFNQASNTVGAITSSARSLYTSPGPITTGSASFNVKAKAMQSSVAASDYFDLLTLIAAGSY